MKKRLLALLLTLVMVVSVMPMSVFATGEETPAGGETPSGNVAKIGTTEYATLKAAVDAAKEADEGEIILLPDYDQYPMAWVTPCTSDNIPEQLESSYTFHAFNPENGDEALAVEYFATYFAGEPDESTKLARMAEALTQICRDGDLGNITGYAAWLADFEISFDDDIADGDVAIMGDYAGYNWLGEYAIPVPADMVNGGKSVRLLNSVSESWASEFTYAYMLMEVFQFHCGVVNCNPGNNAGKTMSVSLYMYDPEHPNVKILIGTTNYTFPAPVAKIGETVYTSLDDAIAAAKEADEGEIILLPDYDQYPMTWVTKRDAAADGLTASYTFHAFNPENGDEKIFDILLADVFNPEKGGVAAWNLLSGKEDTISTLLGLIKENMEKLSYDQKARLAEIADELGLDMATFEYNEKSLLGWRADYEVSFGEDGANWNEFEISGQYDLFGEGWIPYSSFTLEPGESKQLLANMLGGGESSLFDYRTMLLGVNKFSCGFENLNEKANAGKTFSVKLYMYCPENEAVKILIHQEDYTCASDIEVVKINEDEQANIVADAVKDTGLDDTAQQKVAEAVEKLVSNPEVTKAETKVEEAVKKDKDTVDAIIAKAAEQAEKKEQGSGNAFTAVGADVDTKTKIEVKLETIKVDAQSVVSAASVENITVNTAVYDVKPIATVTTTITTGQETETKTETVELTNEDLNGNPVTVRLAVPAADADDYIAKVTHTSEGYPDEIFYAEIKGTAPNQYVEIEMTHFSKVEVMTMLKSEVTFVAQIGEDRYATLQMAINAANDGDVIELLAGVNENVTISGKAVYIKETADTAELSGSVDAECYTITKNKGVLYGDLTKAVSVAKDGGFEPNYGTILFFVLKNITLESDIELPFYGNTNSALWYYGGISPENAVLDLNGHKISQAHGNDGGYWYGSVRVEYTNLTIKDSSELKTGEITGYGSCVVVNAETEYPATVTLESGTLSITGDIPHGGNGIVQAQQAGKFVMIGGTIDGSKVADGKLARGLFELTFLNKGKGKGKVEISSGFFKVVPDGKRDTTEDGIYISPDGFMFNYYMDGTKPVITGGYYDFDPSAYVAEGYAAVVNTESATKADYPFKVVPEGDVVAQNVQTGKKYTTLQAAIAEVANDETIKMLCDVTIDSEVVIPDGKTFTIDLGGKTITTTKDDAFTIDNANLTVKNGTVKHNVTWEPFFLTGVNEGSLTLDDVDITSPVYSVYVSSSSENKTLTIMNCNFNSTSDGVIYASGADTSNTLSITNSTLENSNTGTAALQLAIKATLENVNITSTGATAVVCYENTDLLVKGTENTFTGASGAISTNGSKDLVQITIEGGTFTTTGTSKEAGIAFYHPDGSPLTIKGGTFEGATALYVKGGTIDIQGGTFIGTGAYAAAQKVNSGAYATGDAVVIEASGYLAGENYNPDPNPSVSISGGFFKSTNGSPIAYYTFDGNKEAHDGKMVSGGYFNKVISGEIVLPDKQVIDTPDGTEKDEGYLYTIGVAPVAPSVDEEAEENSEASVPQDAAEGVAEAVVEEVIKEIKDNTDNTTNVQSSEFEKALKNVDTLKTLIDSTSQLKITVKSVVASTTGTVVSEISASTITTTSAKYDVKPWVTIEKTEGGTTTTETRPITNDELKDAGVTITFRLAVPASMTGDTVFVSHYPDGSSTADWVKEYAVLGEGSNRYVELSANSFSLYEITSVNIEGKVAVNVELQRAYATAFEALNEAENGQTVILVGNAKGDGDAAQYHIIKPGVTFDLNGYDLESTGVIVFGGVLKNSEGANFGQTIEGRTYGGKLIVGERGLTYSYGKGIADEGGTNYEYSETNNVSVGESTDEDTATGYVFPVWNAVGNGGYYTFAHVGGIWQQWGRDAANYPKYRFAPEASPEDTGSNDDEIVGILTTPGVQVRIETNYNNINCEYVIANKIVETFCNGQPASSCMFITFKTLDPITITTKIVIVSTVCNFRVTGPSIGSNSAN